MALFEWKDSYNVNVAEIDGQHRKLVEILNGLHDAMLVGKGKDVLGKVLDELIDYTVYHFGTEEKLFQKFKYPEGPEHVKEHEYLKEKVLEVRDKFRNGAIMLSIEVMFFLKDWLNNHILGSDKRAGAYLNGQGLH